MVNQWALCIWQQDIEEQIPFVVSINIINKETFKTNMKNLYEKTVLNTSEGTK